ncbi:MAG: type II toxin-antitoxin system RelE/ParE family toxin [Lacipirellulaceae bacterium]
MKQYKVRTSPHATEKIAYYGSYIAHKSASLEVADHWVDQVYAAIDTLAHAPYRFELAEENAHRDYEVRCRVIGNYLALYTVDEEAGVVRVLNFRHSRQLPQPEELP